MPTNFLSLPLELRIEVYRHAVQQQSHIFADGVPALLRCKLQITQEIYQFCKITTQLILDKDGRLVQRLAASKIRRFLAVRRKGIHIILRFLCERVWWAPEGRFIRRVITDPALMQAVESGRLSFSIR